MKCGGKRVSDGRGEKWDLGIGILGTATLDLAACAVHLLRLAVGITFGQ